MLVFVMYSVGLKNVVILKECCTNCCNPDSFFKKYIFGMQRINICNTSITLYLMVAVVI